MAADTSPSATDELLLEGRLGRAAGESDFMHVLADLQSIRSLERTGEVRRIAGTKHPADPDAGRPWIFHDESYGAVAIHLGDRVRQRRVVERHLSPLPRSDSIERRKIDSGGLAHRDRQALPWREVDHAAGAPRRRIS